MDYKKNKSRNAAIICINTEVLLDWLQFHGGTIHSIGMPKDIWRPDEIEILIEHPDLYEVRTGDILMKITPVYTGTERIEPPKKPIRRRKNV